MTPEMTKYVRLILQHRVDDAELSLSENEDNVARIRAILVGAESKLESVQNFYDNQVEVLAIFDEDSPEMHAKIDEMDAKFTAMTADLRDCRIIIQKLTDEALGKAV